MTRIFIFALNMFFTASAIASSNIAGTWINNGDTLSIQIVDDPSMAPYLAGEIWAAMKATGGLKTIKTTNFELKCSGLTNESGNTFGSCKIKVAKNIVKTQPTETNFAISRDEGKLALDEFIQPSYQDSILVKSGSNDQNGRDQF
ncbi:MAG: hypothetical protein KDD45_16175, partial [Bdellovibrionales bacterium]|nr:hypothetical protein [Bdellovibrionales bacterium]